MVEVLSVFSAELKQLAEFYKYKKTTSNLTRNKKPIYYELLEATTFLPENATSAQRLYHVRNDLHEIPKCNHCKIKSVKWITTYKPSQYAQYCCATCTSNSSITQRKKRETIRKQYGVDHYSQTTEFKESQTGKTRSEETRRKMRVYCANKTDTEKQQSLEKRRQTNLNRYGHINVLATDKVKKIKKDKYGTENYVETQEFKVKRKQNMLKNYGVEYSGQSKELIEKRQRTNLERYGSQSWSNHHISDDVLSKLNSREWLYEHHIEKKIPSTELAKHLGVDKETIGNYLKKVDLERVRHPSSYPEQQLCNLLDEHNITYTTNTRSIIPPKELDIYIPDHNLAIEYCGLYWHSSAQNYMTKNYHKNKLEACNSKGIKLLTIFEDEWIRNEQIVVDKILNILGIQPSQKVYARKCNIVLVSTKDKRKFYNENHIQGDGPSSVNIGLEYNGNIVAIMGFIKQQNQHYLNRYATSCSVVGGFSKLLTYFKQNYSWSRLVSFADLRWSSGDLYNKTGWELESILPPDYSYVELQNIKRIHKFNFRHKNLSNILGDSYNPKLSETENTRNNNWFKIYNCGLQRWVQVNDGD